MAASYDLIAWQWDEENDLKNFAVWVSDIVHDQPMPPLVLYNFGYQHGLAFFYSHEKLSIPEAKGWLWRFVDGWPRLALVEPKPEEVEGRTKAFRERIAPLIEGHDKLWPEAVSEMLERYRPFKEVEIEKVSDVDLMLLFEEVWLTHKRQWFTHMYWMFFYYSMYLLFAEMCNEVLGFDEHDPKFKKLMSGFDNMLFRVNKELWRLGNQAREMGLADIFLNTPDDEDVLRKLEGSDAGRQWLEEYRVFLNQHGWRTAHMLRFDTPSWVEKPSLGISDIRSGIAKGGAFTLDEEREGLEKERKRTEGEVLAKVPVEKREWFEKLMRVAQAAGVFSETHDYYLDLQSHACVRKVTWEIGKRFAQAGTIEEPSDVYFLIPEEVEYSIVPRHSVSLRSQVARRKAEWKKNIAALPPMFVGNPEVIPKMIWKSAALRVTVPSPMVKEELKADLYGTASAPGVVEGIARVIMSQEHLSEVQPGEILVAPGTAAPWTPVYDIIIGVVTDGGGSLSHPVILAREYGIPAVAGCVEGTAKIRTGSKIRVDGDNGVVYILG
jgi:phosphohistidine swiveling domain-containing protein